MKIKFLFTLISAALFHQLTFAQAYMKVGGGYAFSASNSNFSSPIIQTERVSSTFNKVVYKEYVFGTLGGGGQARVAVGYNFAKNFGLELDVNYLYGTTKYVSANTNITSNKVEKSYANTRQLRLTPTFVVRAGEGLVRPYAGFGIVLPVAGSTYLMLESQQDSLKDNVVRKVSGNFSVGFESYVGATFNWPNENFNIFVEMRYVGLGVVPKYAKVVSYDRTNMNTGVVTDLEPTLSTFSREINFVDALTETSNVFEGDGGINTIAYDSNKPMDKIATTTNFNALGINFGIRMNLVKAKKAE
jgi:hypothetical protein